MCDSDDDYFSDDLVLDDKTLAVLDAEESKFRRTLNAQTQQDVGPPAKRQKTTGTWPPPTVQASKPIARTDTLDDMEDLPDVSIRQDGTYDLQDKQKRAQPPPGPGRVGVGVGVGVGVAPPGSQQHGAVVTATQAGSGTRFTKAAPPSRGFAPPARKTSVAGPARATQVPSRPAPAVRGTRVVRSPVAQPGPSQRASTAQQQVNKNVPSTAASGAFVEELLQQIEELRKKNESVRTEMQSALEAKFSKEGEVTILRKRMEKTAQEHVAQLAKLKAAKDEADAKHVVLQKQYEAEKERLKTELTFRRHELETSAWKNSPKKDTSIAAGPFPTQRQRSSQWNTAGPSGLVPETPRRPRFGVISDFEKSKKITLLETRDLPSGFQTGPLRSQSMGGRKGKEVASFNSIPSSPVVPSASPVLQGSSSRFPQPEVFGTQLNDGGLVEDIVPLADVDTHDVQMVDEGSPAITYSQEDTSVLALPSWNITLHSILLTHTLKGSSLPTLQLLVCASPRDTAEVRSYGAALVQIFDTLGGIPTRPDGSFDRLARIICCALCEITESLAKNNLISPLTAVLNLLTNLAYMLPSIIVLLTSPCTPDYVRKPQLLQVLHHIIQGQLQKLDVTAGDEPSELCSLGRETLSLYEALVWGMPSDLEDRFSACPNTPSLLTTLLHPNHPSWFLIASMRIILWLSSGRSLFRLLLPRPNEPAGSNGEPVNCPEIVLACSLLIDAEREGPEADELKSHIITFFAMLSSMHPDAHTLLVESQELIPSTVHYLCHKVTQVWHEKGTLTSDPLAATRTVQIVNRTALFLHHLVLGGDVALDLREHLSRTPPKTYQGLVHSFILTFGRLSYANPPCWLEAKDRERLAGVADLARGLLEKVIQGPELDLIWETYQDEGEETNDAAMDVDDEEAEAQKIADS